MKWYSQEIGISPQIYGMYWYDKPILPYWQLASAFTIFGINEFSARFLASSERPYRSFIGHMHLHGIYIMQKLLSLHP